MGGLRPPQHQDDDYGATHAPEWRSSHAHQPASAGAVPLGYGTRNRSGGRTRHAAHRVVDAARLAVLRPLDTTGQRFAVDAIDHSLWKVVRGILEDHLAGADTDRWKRRFRLARRFRDEHHPSR